MEKWCSNRAIHLCPLNCSIRLSLTLILAHWLLSGFDWSWLGCGKEACATNGRRNRSRIRISFRCDFVSYSRRQKRCEFWEGFYLPPERETTNSHCCKYGKTKNTKWLESWNEKKKRSGLQHLGRPPLECQNYGPTKFGLPKQAFNGKGISLPWIPLFVVHSDSRPWLKKIDLICPSTYKTCKRGFLIVLSLGFG